MDTRVTNKHILVVGDELVLDEYYTSARIETPHTIHSFDTEEEKVTFIASMSVAKFHELPEIGEWCEGNKVYAYGDDKAKCLQGHYRTHYALEDTPALWLIIPTVVGYPEWKQPLGAHDAYRIGDKVTYNGKTWECTSDYNVYAPGVYGWKEV